MFKVLVVNDKYALHGLRTIVLTVLVANNWNVATPTAFRDSTKTSAIKRHLIIKKLQEIVYYIDGQVMD